MQAQLRKVDKITKKKEIEEENRYFDKYHVIFDKLINFLKTKDVMCYGGFALNELLPAKHKIYSERALPDVDVFTQNGKALAYDVIAFFTEKEGYDKRLTNFLPALHPGTWKVFVDSVQVLDISELPKHVYERLAKNSVRSRYSGLTVVDPQYLRMTLHLMLSKGDGVTTYRWGKVLERLMLFYNVYPPAKCALPEGHTESKIPPELVKDFYMFIKDTDYVLFGMHEIELLLDHTIDRSKSILPVIQMFVNDIDLAGVAGTIVKTLAKKASATASMFSVSKVFKKDDFIPDHVLIYYDNELMATIFHAEVCEGYTIYTRNRTSFRIASVHTVIRMYMSMALSSYTHFEKYHNALECIANTLVILTNKARLTSSRRKKLEDVVGQCYGTPLGLYTMRRNEKVLKMNPVDADGNKIEKKKKNKNKNNK